MQPGAAGATSTYPANLVRAYLQTVRVDPDLVILAAGLALLLAPAIAAVLYRRRMQRKEQDTILSWRRRGRR